MTPLMQWLALLALLNSPLVCLGKTSSSGRHDYRDEDAGVHFTSPFNSYKRKTPAQIYGLMSYQTRSLALAPGLRITSGLYDDNSDAYVLLWVKPEPNQPSLATLKMLQRRQASFGDSGFQFFINKLRGIYLKDDGLGQRRRILVQLMRGQATFVGFFSAGDSGADSFHRLESTLSVLPSRALPTGSLPRQDYMRDPLRGGLLMAFSILFIAWCLWKAKAKSLRPR